MSIGLKIIVFIFAMFVITIVKDIAPNLTIPVSILGGFIALRFFFYKNKPSTTKTDSANNNGSEETEIDEKVNQQDSIPLETITESESTKDESIKAKPEIDLKTDNASSNKENQKSVTLKSWRFHKNLTQTQKIIFSLSVFAVLLIISYALAESIDREMRMRKTWVIWVGFILSQTWLQNKFWNSGSTFEINAKVPQTENITVLRSNPAVLFLYYLACIFIVVFLNFVGYYKYNYFVWESLNGLYLAFFHLAVLFIFSLLIFWPCYKLTFGFLFINPHKNKPFYIQKIQKYKEDQSNSLIKLSMKSKLIFLAFFALLTLLNPSPKTFREYIEGKTGYNNRNTYRKYNFFVFSIYVNNERGGKEYVGVCLNFIEISN